MADAVDQLRLRLLARPASTRRRTPSGATVKADAPRRRSRIFKDITDRFPNVTVVRIRDAIQTASEVLGNIGLAVRLIGLFSILAGILVLAGAMLATQRRRIHEAVVMKVLGATRARIAGTFAWGIRDFGPRYGPGVPGGGGRLRPIWWSGIS
jgi:predicted lysophospholipase L1 biosynthesis ABC-type transport system permease subunit